MNTQNAIVLISQVEVKKVEVILSLSGVTTGTPLQECLWPRVTFSCNGVEKTYPFTYWRRMKDSGSRVGGPNPPVVTGRKSFEHDMTEIAFLAAGLRPCSRPMVLADAAEAMGKMLHKQIQKKIYAAVPKKSFIRRHQTLMRKIERADGKKKLRELLLSLPHRLEKRDVVEAWEEAVVTKVMEM